MSEMTPTERAGLAVSLLYEARAAGMAGLTANEMAERLGLTTNGARRMLNRLSRVVPATKIDDAWAICGSDGSFDD